MIGLDLNLVVLRTLWNVYIEFQNNLPLLLVPVDSFYPDRAYLCHHTANAPSAANIESHCQL